MLTHRNYPQTKEDDLKALNENGAQYFENTAMIALCNKLAGSNDRAHREVTYDGIRFSFDGLNVFQISTDRWYCCLRKQGAKA